MRRNIVRAKFDLLNNCRGLSLFELLIGALITGIMSAAAFIYYSQTHVQSKKQQGASEVQLMARASISEMRRTLYMAGGKSNGQPFYKINGDSLSIYYSDTQPVDTAIYFLREFSSSDYLEFPRLPIGKRLYRLMKQVNSNPPAIFTGYIESIRFTAVDPANVEISITTHTSRFDDSYELNSGYRTFSLTERVNVRNSS